MTQIDLQKEIKFKTARSGGKGGQNVNKVETMVEGYFEVESSNLLNAAQKELINRKLSRYINQDGLLMVKSQTARSQLENKELVIKKMNRLVSQSLIIPKKRIAGKPTEASRQKRLEAKKKKGQLKETRKGIRGTEE
ncbi:MAG: aminoacyl-tRNA hydrolase [Chitinophagaceae bacterium]|nr:aminoacyl-tRNA hydrolase [Chitinophagaceae bacterium]